MSCNIDKKILIAIAVILTIVILWLLYANYTKKTSIKEKFDQKDSEEMSQEEMRHPLIDTQIGSIMDGPGFEKPLFDKSLDVEQNKEKSNVIPSNYYFLDDGANGEFSIQHNLCSKSCCSEQWPTPFKQKYDPYVCNNKDKFVPSNIFCNNSFQDSGCVCLTNKQSSFLYNRGGNGREWF